MQQSSKGKEEELKQRLVKIILPLAVKPQVLVPYGYREIM